MKTKIININSKNPEKEKIKTAAKILRSGGLVAFPTETVYGLGADMFNKKAIKKIFSVKGRPNDNPLIVHIYKKEQIYEVAEKVPPSAKILIEKFWPGPLTIVLTKKKNIPNEVTAKLSSIAIRMPKNIIALELIKATNTPIAAPSANLSGKPSPTSAKHVIDDLNGKIDCILKGNDSAIGLESTVIDLTEKVPTILRPGKITVKQIEDVIGKIKTTIPNSTDTPKSPGMKYKHYSPNAKVIIIKNKKEVNRIYKSFPYSKIKYLAYNTHIKMAKNLFKDFRKADEEGYDIIIVLGVKEKGLGLAIMDRLRKASG